MANICCTCYHGRNINGRDNNFTYCTYWQRNFDDFDKCDKWRERLSIYTQQFYYDNCQYIDAIMKRFEELDKELKEIKEKLESNDT